MSLSYILPLFLGLIASLQTLPLIQGSYAMYGRGWWLAALIFAVALAINTFIAFKACNWVVKSISRVNQHLASIPGDEMTAWAVGGGIGLALGLLAVIPVCLLGIRGLTEVSVLVPFIACYIGGSTVMRRRPEFLDVRNLRSVRSAGLGKDGEASRHNGRKVLDTSVIIDGRIYDIARTGFLEGPLLVPFFVIEELQHIADSSDVLRRNRGRRGLDVLNRMSKDEGINIIIWEGVEEDNSIEVDARLVKLSRGLDATVITNDFNLNKVAELHGVNVLNINELANALKPVVLPGEEMSVRVIRDGKELGQGVGYLDDGTMIVVDGGRRFIGEQIGVQVTSVLQTSAGRMIFARLKPMEKAL